ncbi:ubiquinol-cytochrome c chaperone [Terrihabitans soli]|uniref:Ubiquinol-cytochrome c chaperone n=1 Tax=Terrihabitans soli TaxID=708113 RepID=A0A6S6QSN4_9HYPH|nr:ubiquinol-cytochrome C chaperone family protein [Terrihabitans soli]BCJ90635.1 ubiquinol-cytochrome c chaperone [Terrihabitans soli]
MILRLFRPRKDRARVRAIYAAIVAQARQPAFYAELGVPDTLEGRYDMLMLHAFLYMHRLKDEPEPVKDVAQDVFDFMFSDMDRSLREMGVGDLSVPKKIKKMAQAFYGRASAYDAALAKAGPDLGEAVQRNVFGGGASSAANAASVADYMRRAAKALAGQDAAILTSVGPEFPSAGAARRKAG